MQGEERSGFVRIGQWHSFTEHQLQLQMCRNQEKWHLQCRIMAFWWTFLPTGKERSDSALQSLENRNSFVSKTLTLLFKHLTQCPDEALLIRNLPTGSIYVHRTHCQVALAHSKLTIYYLGWFVLVIYLNVKLVPFSTSSNCNLECNDFVC